MNGIDRTGVSGRRALRAGTLLLTLLLAGCPDPDRLPTVESDTLATDRIGLRLSLSQDEETDEISVGAFLFATDNGVDSTARVELSPTDTLSASVQGQDVVPSSRFPESRPTRFTFERTSLALPATFRVALIREGGRRDARETFLTLSAVFETISPREGDVFPRDGMAEFAWTLRDGDGNAVGGVETARGIVARQRLNPSPLYPPSDFAPFATTAAGPGGITRRGSLPSLALLPPDFIGRRDGPLELDVAVTGWDVHLFLPVTLELDTALANGGTEGLERIDAVAYPSAIPITIR